MSKACPEPVSGSSNFFFGIFIVNNQIFNLSLFQFLFNIETNSAIKRKS